MNVESNALGITYVEVSRDVVDGERVVMARAYDAADAEVAHLRLRTGMVLYTSEPDLIPEQWSLGRELELAIGEERSTMVTPDLAVQELPEPPGERVQTFVRISAIADVLRDDGRIHYLTRDTSDVALATSNCPSNKFPSNVAGSPECCQNNFSQVETYHKVGVSGANYGKIARRVYGTACRDSSGNTGCTTNCTYGPCGAFTTWVWGDSSQAYFSSVFHPYDYPSRECGWDTSTGLYYPRPYQFEMDWPYAGVTGTCPYTGCNANGTPY